MAVSDMAHKDKRFKKVLTYSSALPGRLLDHLSQKSLKLDRVEILILDEVDRMLDMGFIEDVRRIIRQCGKNRQTLFSLLQCRIPYVA